MKDLKREYRFAYENIQKGSKFIGQAGMQLEYTKFKDDYKRVWEALYELNRKLIAELRKK